MSSLSAKCCVAYNAFAGDGVPVDCYYEWVEHDQQGREERDRMGRLEVRVRLCRVPEGRTEIVPRPCTMSRMRPTCFIGRDVLVLAFEAAHTRSRIGEVSAEAKGDDESDGVIRSYSFSRGCRRSNSSSTAPSAGESMQSMTAKSTPRFSMLVHTYREQRPVCPCVAPYSYLAPPRSGRDRLRACHRDHGSERPDPF